MGKTNLVNEFSEEILTLRNGLHVVVRSIRPDDAPRLQTLVSRLSPETIFLRFLEYLKYLTPEQAKILANVDYHKRMALVATIVEDREENVIGVARYSVTDLTDANANEAEVGIVVEDLYQNLGLGSYLLDHLTEYAIAHGIQVFTSTISAQNARIMRFIQRSGYPTERKLESGTWEIRIQLGRNSTGDAG